MYCVFSCHSAYSLPSF
ncbi:hypothetical protein VN97_g11873, partial [Penicillium thymicola]